ncbi:MAG: DUF1552 domain-containing protein [Myxococcales bacterium]|nr:DUF1552 domain-containing protein [Myxococcales bacterium]
MRRRDFIFGSLKAAALLTPVLSLRRAEGASASGKRALVWVNCCGYPYAEDFFPTGGEHDFVLSPILADFGELRDQMVIVDGIDIRNSGLDPKGNNHVRTIGKVLTAKDLLPAADSEDGQPGGISIDQLVANELGVPTLELQVNPTHDSHMRHRPFATGPNAFKPPLANPIDAWNKAFADFQPSSDPAEVEAHLRRLTLKKSLLDDLTGELSRFRSELDGAERLKLDIHEDAIRRAEQSVSRDLEETVIPLACEVPAVPSGDFAITSRAQAHLDLAYAALACERAGVVSMLWGFSGYHWKYEWAGVGNVQDSGHDEVHHLPGQRRADYITMARWDWNQLRTLLERLRATPEGNGTMLDNTVVLAISHFGVHHQMERIPAVLFGSAQGALQTGRYLQLPQREDNDKLLTSFAHLMDVDIAGIGDDPNCGPLAQL